MRIREAANILRDTDPILLAAIIDFHGRIILTLSRRISDISPALMKQKFQDLFCNTLRSDTLCTTFGDKRICLK